MLTPVVCIHLNGARKLSHDWSSKSVVFRPRKVLNVDSSVFTVFRPAPNKHGEPAWSMQVHEAQDV